MTELEKQLLEALKDVLKWVDDWCETGPDMDFERIEEQADAAIAAAEAAATSAQPAAVPDGWRDVVGKAYHFMQDIGEHGVTCAIYDLDEDGKHIQCSCGMDETLRSLNALLVTVPQPAQAEQHAPAPLATARAIEAAAAAIYLADSSDYLGAMWTVLRWLSPDIAALMEKDERAAWGLACTRLTAEANQERTPDANH